MFRKILKCMHCVECAVTLYCDFNALEDYRCGEFSIILCEMSPPTVSHCRRAFFTEELALVKCRYIGTYVERKIR